MLFATRELISQRSIQIIVLCLLSLILCQALKFVIISIKEKKIQYRALFTTGGMPSSHTSTMTTLVFCLGIFQMYDNQGFEYSFAVALATAAIVIHDAMGVRLEASKHAKILNNLVEGESDKTKASLGFENEKKLKELVGHKPLEVFFGFIFGVVIAIIGALIVIL